ncbi:hypothetical protein GCM10009851_11610 [Herbiconiux moechotypicola]|uniref:ABC transmembrane type-1 domain-containing protein n=2 Tax=Herbiconiux moechotypicola TaxID=637393 RepID=A0ABP5Q8S9_9MICO
MRAGFAGAAVRRIASTLGFMLLALVVITVIWDLSVRGLGLDSFGTPTPWRVWEWWALEPDSAEHRRVVFDALGVTVRHALSGYVVGSIVGIGLAVVFTSAPRIERASLPTVLFIQTVPILAILPLFILIFGRGDLVTTAIVALTVFFPTLVWVSQGLRSPHPTTVDLFRSLDATRTTVMIRLRFPSAVAGLFVAARLAVPGALFGAFVAEWLATGDGLGYLVVTSMQAVGGFSPLWAAVSATTLLTMIAYVAVEIVEAIALARYDPDQLAAH